MFKIVWENAILKCILSNAVNTFLNNNTIDLS